MSRGESFRLDYLRLGELRSIIPSNVNVLALTATASSLVFEAASSVLHMRSPAVIAAPPDRPNIFLSVINRKEIMEVVQDIASTVLHSQQEMDQLLSPRHWCFAESKSAQSIYTVEVAYIYIYLCTCIQSAACFI